MAETLTLAALLVVAVAIFAVWRKSRRARALESPLERAASELRQGVAEGRLSAATAAAFEARLSELKAAVEAEEAGRSR